MTEREKMGVIGYFMNDGYWRGNVKLPTVREPIVKIYDVRSNVVWHRIHEEYVEEMPMEEFEKLDANVEVDVIGLDGNVYRIKKSDLTIMNPGEEWEA